MEYFLLWLRGIRGIDKQVRRSRFGGFLIVGVGMLIARGLSEGKSGL